MKIIDIAIIAVIALAVFLALFFIIKKRKRGSCCGCGGNCTMCSGCENKKKE